MTSQAKERTRARPDAALLALGALVGGAVAMGASPIFVRFADVGPYTSAFWRVALALPVLWLWARLEERGGEPRPVAREARPWIALAGALFAGDLIFWHLAIVHTSVANATFLATLAPVWVVLGSGFVLREAIPARTFGGLALGLLGAAALMGADLRVAPQQLVGDLYGVITSMFFGAYFLAVRRARRGCGAGRMLFLSSLVTAALLLVAALVMEDRMWPAAAGGVAALVALALVSHSGGQGLLAYALGHLPAAFSAIVVFLEGIAAAALGWVVLGEAMGPLQFAGAAAIFAGIAVARPRRDPPP
ncbi:MAG TPA: DMT family transporter [Afifellaceae bacterium]|nr:DMT family transporter [Afifellaceae bacterium]